MARLSNVVQLAMHLVTSQEAQNPHRQALQPPADIRFWSFKSASVWAGPFSLAATKGVSVDFRSSGYLDVSVPLLTFS